MKIVEPQPSLWIITITTLRRIWILQSQLSKESSSKNLQMRKSLLHLLSTLTRKSKGLMLNSQIIPIVNTTWKTIITSLRSPKSITMTQWSVESRSNLSSCKWTVTRVSWGKIIRKRRRALIGWSSLGIIGTSLSWKMRIWRAMWAFWIVERILCGHLQVMCCLSRNPSSKILWKIVIM